ncbi:bactericidal permeability-increasing protein-like [Labeo rohita]|uniref:bactericidal permeability-increasing protein-like n=1 Tax=Labeo rohita TaxID=84645 RepID=UPI0021E1C65C|nr:bactericidal permeability-increasing protein-like [Labeo rohita]
MVFCWCALALLTLAPVVTGNNAGVKVRLTQRGLDYAVSPIIKQVLLNMEIPDQEGTGRLKYIAKGLKIYNLENFKLVQTFVRGTGVRIEVSANIYMSGNVTVDRRVHTFGPSNLTVDTLSISAFVAVKRDEHPTFKINECTANIGRLDVDLQNGCCVDSCVKGIISCSNWGLRWYIARKICPLLENYLDNLNTQLATMNATINEYAAIDYSLRSVDITDTSIELGLKGIFYNTPRTQEPRFPSTAVSCTSLNSKMFCVAISAFTINSAFSVFHNTGVFNITITDDMIPSVSPIRLSTTTFGAFVPQISEKYPDLKLELEVKTVKEPDIQFEPNNVILKIFSTVTAVQSGNRLTQLFILNLESSASVQVSVREDKLVLALNLEKIDVSMNTKTFKFTNLSFLNMAIKDILFPIIKAHLAKDFPLPGLLRSTMVRFINPQVEVLKDYVMIGTDIQFGENT